jgi:hypothetical protein
MSRAHKYLLVYASILVLFTVIAVFLLLNINYFNNLYSFKQTNLNISSLCSQNKSTMIFYYSNGCSSCSLEYAAFRNVTSRFEGEWISEDFYSPYFCAYDFNITLYNQNQSAVFAPVGAAGVFTTLADGKVPFVFFGGIYSQYYKIGGFSTNTSAEEQLLKYMCLSINNIAPVCSTT